MSKKQNSPEESTSSRACVPPAGWNELPAELLDMILQKLPLDVRCHHLKCRRVNVTWKNAIDSILERDCLSTWTKWEPAETLAENTFEPFPIMSIAPTGTGLNFVFCPAGITNWQGNPFPTNCLTICNKVSWKNYMMTHKENWMKVDKIFAEFGSCLTSLVLQDISISIPTLKRMLEKMANLKALSLKKVLLEKTDDDKLSLGSQSCPVVYSSKLAHFHADQQCHPELIQWLVNTFGHQLKTMEVRGHTLKPFQLPDIQVLSDANGDNTGDKTRLPYHDLKQFKIFSPTKSFLQLTLSFPLHRLSISHIRRSQNINLTDLINFIDKFSNSLSFLHVDVNFCHELDMKERPKDSPRRLMNLHQFDVRFPKTSAEALLVIKQLFLPKFPNLKCLRFLFRYDKSVDYHGNTDGIKKSMIKFIGEEKFGEFCPKLEDVYIDRFHSPVLRANENV